MTLPPACCSHKPPPPLPTQLSASHRYQAAFRIMLNMKDASQLGPGEPLPCFVSDFCTSIVLSPSGQPGKRSIPECSRVPTLGRRRGFTCSSSALLCCCSWESSQSTRHELLFSVQRFQLSFSSGACHPTSIPTGAGFPRTPSSRTWAAPQAAQFRHSDSKEAAMGGSWGCSRGLGRGAMGRESRGVVSGPGAVTLPRSRCPSASMSPSQDYPGQNPRGDQSQSPKHCNQQEFLSLEEVQ